MSNAYETLQSMTKAPNMNGYADHVIRWNDVAYQARGQVRTDFDLQWSFIQEEFGELVDALRAGDRVEVVDAACDLFVVASFACWLKSPRHLNEACEFSDTLIFTVGDLEHNLYGNQRDAVYVLKLVVALCRRLDINLDYNMKQVLSSNDSKYPTIEQLRVAYPTLCDYTVPELLREECREIAKRSEGRYSNIRSIEVGNRVVFFDGKGKIMKPITFVNPEIKV